MNNILILLSESISSLGFSEIFAFATVAISLFAALKLDAINRNLGELSNEVKNHKEVFITLKEDLNKLMDRVAMIEKEILKQKVKEKQ